jgi:hypothetical protein
VSTAPPPTLQERATACLTDPTCPAAEADRLFRVADDARLDTVDCLRFADGDGTTKDLSRARACLLRTTSTSKCDGSSAGLSEAELAIYLIDGVGGPEDIPAARRVFDGCFNDVTAQAVLAHADAKAANPGAPGVDFCKDYGGTTLTANACLARARQHEETRAALQAKSVVAGLDDEGKRLFAVASAAYTAYVDAMGSYVYEVFKDGSIRNAMALEEESGLLARRTAEVAGLGRVAPKAAAPIEIERAARKVDAALKKQSAAAATEEIRGRIAEAQRAWVAYREAETALEVRAFAAKANEEAVRGAEGVRLDEERVSDVERRTNR